MRRCRSGCIDLDYFKRVNDTISHYIGDEVLKQVALLLADAVTEPAFAARLGGEEFLLVLPDCAAREAVACCESARMLLHTHNWGPLVGRLPVTASFGVTTSRPVGPPARRCSLTPIATSTPPNVPAATGWSPTLRDPPALTVGVAHTCR